MLPVLNLGPLSLPLPELILILGFWGGSIIIEKFNPSRYKHPDFLERLLWISLLAGIIGARISFFARHPESFQGNYLSLLSLNLNLFDLGGGLVIAAGTALFLITRKKMDFISTIDGLIPFLSFFTMSIHLSKFSSGAGYGIPTNLPWGLQLWGSQRHPVQIYYFFGGLLVFLIVNFYLPRIRYTQGIYISSFIFLISMYLLLFSRYQSPDTIIIEGIRFDQIIYWLGSLLGLYFLNRITTPEKNQEAHVIKK